MDFVFIILGAVLRFDEFLQRIIHMVTDEIYQLIVNVFHLVEDIKYKQVSQKIVWTIWLLLAIAYPLLGLTFFIAWRVTKKDTKELIELFATILFYILLIIFIAIIMFGEFHIGHLFVNGPLHYLLAFDPLRGALACLGYKVLYENGDFLVIKPDEWAVKKEEEDEELETFDAYEDSNDGSI